MRCYSGSYISSGECVKCEENTYNAEENAKKCTPCPEGHVSEPGSKSEDDCIPGKYLETFSLCIIARR